MKRFIAMLLCICMCSACLPVVALGTAEAFDGGSGTAADPYLVSTPEQLNAVRQNLSGHYRQINDIDLSGYGNWKPIGGDPSQSDPEPFSGSYDGGHFEIAGLRVDSQEANSYFDSIGLFASTDGATLSNIHMVDISISAFRGNDDYVAVYNNYGIYIGGICGKSRSTEYKNCSVSGAIQLRDGCNSYIGGIAGEAVYDTLKGCVNNAAINAHSNRDYSTGLKKVSSDAYAGGIVGYAKKSEIAECTNQSSVHIMAGGCAFAGGICGAMNDGSIIDAVNSASIRSELDTAVGKVKYYGASAGGIVGDLQLGSLAYQYDYTPYIQISRCVNYGAVYCRAKDKAKGYAGGIIGFDVDHRSGEGYSNLTSLFQLGADVTSATEGNEAGDGKCCATICGYSTASSFSGCFALDTTLLNGAALTEEDKAANFYSEGVEGRVNGATRPAQKLLETDTYSGFDFQKIWNMDAELGGPVLLSADQSRLQQIKIEVSSIKTKENAIESPIEGAYQYEINAKFENTTEAVLENVVADISLRGGLSLVSVGKSEVSLGNLQPGQIVWAGWTVNAPWPDKETNAGFTVTANIDKSVEMAQDGAITLAPHLTYRDIHGWPLLNWEHSFGYGKPYRIPVERYEETFGYKLSGTALGYLKQILKWNGNCFGLSLLSLGHYYGKFDLTTCFNKNGDELNAFGYEGIYTDKENGKQCYTVAGNQQALELIERAQIAQNSAELKKVEVFDNDSNYSQVISFMSSNDARPLLVTADDHAMVVTTDFKPYLATNGEMAGWFVLPLYDPNAPTIDGGLSDPEKFYAFDHSYLWLNPETGEWIYSRNNEIKRQNKYYAYRQMIHFYDVSKLEPSFFREKLSLADTRFEAMIYGYNAVIDDDQGNILFALENGKLVQASKDCEVSTQLYSNGDYLPVFTVSTDAKNIRISSKDAVVALLQGENLCVMEMDGTYTVYSNSKAGGITIDSQQAEGAFTVCTQDKHGNAAKITGTNIVGNRVSVRQAGTEVSVKTQDPNTNITYECENITLENVAVSVVKKVPAWGEKDFAGILIGVGIGAVVCLLLVGVAFVMRRKKKQ